MDDLIDIDVLFQTCLEQIDGITAGADLGPTSADEIPFVTHNSTIAQTEGPGLWTVILTLTIYLEVTTTTFEVVKSIYRALHEWGTPPFAIVPGLAGIESVEDIQAFGRVGQSVDLYDKSVTQYVGQFTVTVRNQ